jgi:2'-5' RNA ligase
LADRLRGRLRRACPGAADAVALDRIGAFRGANVTWLAPSAPPPWLGPLAEAVRRGLDEAGIAYDRKPFVPHLTLARGARAPAAEVEPLVVSGWRVALVASGGPAASGGRYRVLAWLDTPPDAPDGCHPIVTGVS